MHGTDSERALLIRKTITAVLGGALTVGALLGAGQAHATIHHVNVSMRWHGTNCISWYGPLDIGANAHVQTGSPSARLRWFDAINLRRRGSASRVTAGTVYLGCPGKMCEGSVRECVEISGVARRPCRVS